MNGKISRQQISRILNSLYRSPGITRKELEQTLKLDKSRIISHIHDLNIKGYITEKDSASKKNIPLYLSSKKIFAAGLKFSSHSQCCVITDLSGNIIEEKQWNLPNNNLNTFLDNTLAEYITHLPYRISAIGITTLKKSEFPCHNPRSKVLENNKIPLFSCNNLDCLGWDMISFDKVRDDFILLYSEEDPSHKSETLTDWITLDAIVVMKNRIRKCMTFNEKFYNDFLGPNTIPPPQKPRYDNNQLYVEENTERLNAVTHSFFTVMGFLANYIDVDTVYIKGFLEQNRSFTQRQLSQYIMRYNIFPHIQKIKLRFAETKEKNFARGAAGFAFENIFRLANGSCENQICHEIFPS